MRIKPLVKIAFSFAISLVLAQAAFASTNPRTLARQAVSENSNEATAAISELRAMGPAGLDALFETYSAEVKLLASDNPEARSDSLQRVSFALDSVSQQRNSYASRLFWFTDFEKAKAAAQASGKPILSLRLLGNLNEEYSCANSRFFRTVLYANKTVSDVLRERFILHWKSVRPAPRVTIDYGDGRKLERTLTGNSIHYVLSSKGDVIDAMPGLYGPQAFLRGIERAEAIGKLTNGKSEAERTAMLSSYHMAQVEAIGKQWTADAKQVGAKIPDSIVRDETSGKSFDARVAARTAMSKMVSEISIINAISYDTTLLKEATDEATWAKIAALHTNDARLDHASIALIRRQHSFEKGSAIKDDQLARVVANFERYLAFDSVRNEYTMHATLHSWLSSRMSQGSIDVLNERVYKNLFLTPSSDPWLGLYSPDTYTALENGGLSQ